MITSSTCEHVCNRLCSPHFVLCLPQVSLRAIDPERFAIVNEAAGGEVMEEIEASKAFYEVYDGAVYMFQVLKTALKTYRGSRIRRLPCSDKMRWNVQNCTDTITKGALHIFPASCRGHVVKQPSPNCRSVYRRLVLGSGLVVAPW